MSEENVQEGFAAAFATTAPEPVEEPVEPVEPDVEVARTRAVIGNYIHKGVKYPPRAVVTVRPELAAELLELQHRGRPVFVRTA